MNARIRSPLEKIRHVRLHRRQPSLSIDDLALMLEIELALHRAKDFRRRLQRALDDAWAQGAMAHAKKD